MRPSIFGPREPSSLEVPVARTATIVRRVLIVLLLLSAAVATLLWARQARRPREIVLSGTLEARTVNVGSLVGGRVVRVLTDEGQPVHARQVIAQLETATLDRQISEPGAPLDPPPPAPGEGIH